jgi:hypothetical protein
VASHYNQRFIIYNVSLKPKCNAADLSEKPCILPDKIIRDQMFILSEHKTVYSGFKNLISILKAIKRFGPTFICYYFLGPYDLDLKSEL